MNDNLKKYCFQELINEQHKIRIPKIQRDYAQGRMNENVNEIRKAFVHTLLSVVRGKRKDTELDFVYGSTKHEAFEPLDGQQRLTTLFLLHWMLGVNLATDDGKHSVFSYETRNTSEEFCNELVAHKSILFIKESMDEKSVPSKIISKHDWFKWEWKFDPTISSMLVMIDAIYDELVKEFPNSDNETIQGQLDKCADNLKHITFNKLNLGEFGFSDELFIKMNARGKQLSDFDKLKSTLEEELQIQQVEVNENKEPLATQEHEEKWRSLMDGEWIDLFWHKYARRIVDETADKPKEERRTEQLKAAFLTEIQFKKLLLRLIALQLFENQNTCESLSEAAYNINEDAIDRLLSVYSDSLIELRSEDSHSEVDKHHVTINFARLIEDMNLLIYKEKEDETLYEISYLLSKNSHIENDDRSLFDMFLERNVGNDVMLVFYSMLLFLRTFPPHKEKQMEDVENAWYFDHVKHSCYIKNLEYWVSSMRNILLNDNINQRIDNRYLAIEAIQNLNELVDLLQQFVEGGNYDIETDGTVILNFIKDIELRYPRLDNQSFNEEKTKAGLILSDSKWEPIIRNAEAHTYLWGQIRCLLEWAKLSDEGTPIYDMGKFTDYSTRLQKVLDYINLHPTNYYAVILALYPKCWETTNRLYQLNRDRDNSIKRFLREKNNNKSVYGETLKSLIDLWAKEDNESAKELIIDAFIENTIDDCKSSENPLAYVVSNAPQILEESWNKRIYMSEHKHVVLAQRKTEGSHCFDPVFLYFKYYCRKNNVSDSDFTLFDSKSIPTHAFQLNTGDGFMAKWSEQDEMYVLAINEQEQELTAIELIKKVETIIDNIQK